MSMPAQRFEIGQSIALRSKPKRIYDCDTGKTIDLSLLNPGEIYHVSYYEIGRKEQIWFIGLVEKPGRSFEEKAFNPVELTDTEITALLEETQHIEI